ncbi:MAG: S49 family peptidase, partial [Fuerstiella sp.]
TDFDTYDANRSVDEPGRPIAVVTVAGEIVDGDAGPGTAGGDRIADLIDEAATDDDLAALVLRVDSPGGSVTASDAIRRALLRVKAKDIPIVVSMANVAASGGYWVSTPADRIFAEPGTITGSIGIFGIIDLCELCIERPTGWCVDRLFRHGNSLFLRCDSLFRHDDGLILHRNRLFLHVD